jgi:hypothetical protein
VVGHVPAFFAGERYVRFGFCHQMHASLAKHGSMHSATPRMERIRSIDIELKQYYLAETFRGLEAVFDHLNNMGGRLHFNITSSNLI